MSELPVNQIDWDNWEPVDRATLLFVIKDSKILLIHKKCGLGKGKINGPGGRIEPNETVLEAAVREVQEETCVTPIGIEFCGELSFQFCDGYSLHGSVFKASDYAGEPAETEEAIPLWVPLDEIPYDRMWEDDPFWMPLMLAGKKFCGRFLFNGDKMLFKEIEEL